MLLLLVFFNTIVISTNAQQYAIAGTWSYSDLSFKETFIFKADSTIALYLTQNTDPGIGSSSEPKMGKYSIGQNELSFFWNDNQTETWQIKFIDPSKFELTFFNKKTKQFYKPILFRKV